MPRQNNEPDFYGPAPLPRFPTAALPGTKPKVDVLEVRFALGQNLWHPEDAIMTSEIEKRIRLKLKELVVSNTTLKDNPGKGHLTKNELLMIEARDIVSQELVDESNTWRKIDFADFSEE